MALEWTWSEPCGFCKVNFYNSIENLTLYRGNALLIFMYETDTEYNLVGFFTDKEHAKNCLGLQKGYSRWSLDVLDATLYYDKCDWKHISEYMLKAYPHLRIELKHSPTVKKVDE